MSRSVRYLSRREQELLDGLYREGHMTASETYRRTGSTRSYSTVRTQLRALEHKEYVKRKQRQGIHVYSPATPKRQARDRAFRHFLQTFFDGSLDAALQFILTSRRFRLTEGTRRRVIEMCTATDASTRRETAADNSIGARHGRV
jgi:predicted transcriptional regulator